MTILSVVSHFEQLYVLECGLNYVVILGGGGEKLLALGLLSC